ncbi:MAG: LuxR C-terminal-related transcriptional regulator [Chloroflexi bacterium]|nr:LuxR C-terminal-related transcriptional regulator [Chloroflexota bacterium]MBU1659911.1 LuxR C-terminal-related transcriptional regulator [Chloroflexota bacterium]
MTDTPLSSREQEILRLMATGVSNKEISQQLYISINTVKVHLRNIYAKLEVSSRTEAAMWAVQNGLVNTGTPPRTQDINQDEKQADDISADGHRLHSANTIPQRMLPWFVAGAAIILVLAGIGINRAWQSSQATATPDALTAASAVEQSRWQQLADMPTARAGLAAAAYDNLIYAIGGEGIDGPVNANERYDPQIDTWETLTPKPVPVADVHAGVIGGKIYVPGGRLANGGVTNILAIYDPRSDAWTEGSPLPVALSAYALAAFEGRLYLFGGWDGEKYVDSVYGYDPTLDQWRSLPPMPTPRGFAGAVAAGGKVFVIGGFDGQQALTTHEVFFPDREGGAAPLWEQQAAPLPAARYAMGVAVVADVIHIVGGLGEVYDYISVAYFPRDDRWQAFETPPNDVGALIGIVSVGSYLYVIGGQLNGTHSGQNLAYQAIYTLVLPILR